jgi:two-component system response regulator FlrC
VSADAQAALLACAWPGNVRELENVVQRAMVLCNDHHIDTHHLMFDDASTSFLRALESKDSAVLAMPSATHSGAQALAKGPLQATVQHSEHQAIQVALDSSLSREEAAQKLGISPRTLRYKMARLRNSAAGQSVHF